MAVYIAFACLVFLAPFVALRNHVNVERIISQALNLPDPDTAAGLMATAAASGRDGLLLSALILASAGLLIWPQFGIIELTAIAASGLVVLVATIFTFLSIELSGKSEG